MWVQFTSEMNAVASVQSNRGSLNVFFADPRYLIDCDCLESKSAVAADESDGV
jgi:hypothetical protein